MTMGRSGVDSAVAGDAPHTNRPLSQKRVGAPLAGRFKQCRDTHREGVCVPRLPVPGSHRPTMARGRTKGRHGGVSLTPKKLTFLWVKKLP